MKKMLILFEELTFVSSSKEILCFLRNTFNFLPKQNKRSLLLATCMALAVYSSYAQRKMENLGRGVVAIRPATNQAFISWRVLGTEPANIAFNLYKRTGTSAAVKLNSTPITGATNWQDTAANFSQANLYYVTAIINGAEQAASASFTLPANVAVQPFLSFGLQPLARYKVKFIWVGDLDGDGEYDFVFDRQPDTSINTIVVEAYKRDGTFLWRVDCGPNSLNRYNIEPGASAIDIGHGDGITVYDINNDGRAEVLLKTANGVRLPNGTVITDANDNRQFVSVLEGTTGRELNRVIIPNDFLNDGPLNGHFGIAYLDGSNPSLVFSAKNRVGNGGFNMIVSAWTWNGGGLTQNWKWVRPNNGNFPDGHNIRCVDLDGDGRDEVFPMGFVLRPNGTVLYSLGDRGIVHGDRFHIGDLDRNHPGIEGYAIQQDNPSGLAWAYFDGRTGNILQSQTLSAPKDLARGTALDLDPRYDGYEFHTFTDGLYNVSGARTTTALPGSYPNLRHWWDGDVLGENLDNSKFTKWNYNTNTEERLYTARDVAQVGPNTPGFYGDLLGDWREEVVYTSSDQQSIRIYTTPIPTTVRLYTLAHNPAYRNCMTTKGYYQSNMVDYYLGQGMTTPPNPNITLVTGNLLPPIEGRYLITARHSGKALYVSARSAANGGDVIQWTVNGGTNQLWDLTSVGGGYYRITNVNSGKAMEIAGNSTANGGDVVQQDYTGAANQQWQVNDLGNGYYSIINRNSGRAIDIERASTLDSADAIQYTYRGSNNQQFGLVDPTNARIIATTGIQQNNRLVTVYPNPSATAFNINTTSPFTYTVYDNHGRLLKNGRGTNNLQIGADLKPGVYLLNIKSGNGVSQYKLIKQ